MMFGFVGIRVATITLAVLLTAFAPAHAAERLPDDADSHVALLLVIIISVIAAGLAATRVKRNRLAIAATSLVLLIGSAALLIVKFNGNFSSFKAPATPLDFVKSPLLTAFAMIGVVAGVVLAAIWWRVSQGPSVPQPLSARNEAIRYGKVSRFLHWSIALIFIALMPMGVFMSGLQEGVPLREPLYIIHKSLGMALTLLVAVRIGWHLTNEPPALSQVLSRSNRIGAKLAHILFYLLMVGFPVTGYFMSSYAGKVIPFFYIDLPVWLEPSKDNAMPFGLLHKFALPIVFYVVFVAHVAGVLKHHFLDGHKDAIRRMSG